MSTKYAVFPSSSYVPAPDSYNFAAIVFYGGNFVENVEKFTSIDRIVANPTTSSVFSRWRQATESKATVRPLHGTTDCA